jgi:hypothetical protein
MPAEEWIGANMQIGANVQYGFSLEIDSIEELHPRHVAIAKDQPTFVTGCFEALGRTDRHCISATISAALSAPA